MNRSEAIRVHVASRGNGFMTDIATWIAEALTSTGRRAEVVLDTLPTDDGDLHLVVAPHEFFTLTTEKSARSARAVERALAVSVLISTEQPGTSWFATSARFCARARAVADINPTAVAALEARGIAATHLPLGAVGSMIAPGSDEDRRTRSVDVMFLGGLDPRRAAGLAELAADLAPLATEIRCVISDRPLLPGAPGVVVGAEKYARLADARILVNLHRDRGEDHEPYLEWVRVIEALANRTVVVTEPVDDYGPLVPGTHILAAPLAEMGALIHEVLADPDRLDAIADQGFSLVTEEMDLAGTLAEFCDRWAALPARTPRAGLRMPRQRPATTRRRVLRPHLGLFQPFEDLRAEAKRLALAEQRLLRALDRTDAVIRHGDPDYAQITTSPADAAGPVEVSVVVTLYNYAAVVAETLHSLAASTDVNFEVIVIDDHSSDDSVAVAHAALRQYPDLRWRLVAQATNGGLAAARNLGIEMATGEYVMILDADNHVYPRALGALAATLDAEPTAAATWSILEDFGASRGLRSAVAWDVERLCAANYLDAQSMWRRSELIDLGGYRGGEGEDGDLVYGWEDWDLWLRLADRGGHAVLHPEILGRYRVQEVSMIALTNLARARSIQALRDRYPNLPWPAEIAL